MTCEGPIFGRDVPIHKARILAVAQDLTSNGFGS